MKCVSSATCLMTGIFICRICDQICVTTENNICYKKMLLLLFLFMWIEKDDSLAIKGTHLQVFRLVLTNQLIYHTQVSHRSCAEILFQGIFRFLSFSK